MCIYYSFCQIVLLLALVLHLSDYTNGDLLNAYHHYFGDAAATDAAAATGDANDNLRWDKRDPQLTWINPGI